MKKRQKQNFSFAVRINISSFTKNFSNNAVWQLFIFLARTLLGVFIFIQLCTNAVGLVTRRKNNFRLDFRSQLILRRALHPVAIVVDKDVPFLRSGPVSVEGQGRTNQDLHSRTLEREAHSWKTQSVCVWYERHLDGHGRLDGPRSSVYFDNYYMYRFSWIRPTLDLMVVFGQDVNNIFG